MTYTIGEVATQTGIPISTLRYYDKEGLFPNIKKSNSGIRIFTDLEMETITIIECLKMSGLSIKEIKQFLDWCQLGDNSLEERQALFHERLEAVNDQIEKLQKTISVLKYKCWYYDTAVAAGTEQVHKITSYNKDKKHFECCDSNNNEN